MLWEIVLRKVGVHRQGEILDGGQTIGKAISPGVHPSGGVGDVNVGLLTRGQVHDELDWLSVAAGRGLNILDPKYRVFVGDNR